MPRYAALPAKRRRLMSLTAPRVLVGQHRRAACQERRITARAGRAGEPAVRVVAAAPGQRPGAQGPLAERGTAGVPPDAAAELAPEDRRPELIADDGAHGPPPPHGRQPPERRRLRGRRPPTP